MFRTSTVHPQEHFQAVCCKSWYVAIRVLLDTSRCYAVVGRTGLGAVPDQDQFFLQSHNIWTYRVVRKSQHTKIATYSL